jgi:hypothetical protein
LIDIIDDFSLAGSELTPAATFKHYLEAGHKMELLVKLNDVSEFQYSNWGKAPNLIHNCAEAFGLFIKARTVRYGLFLWELSTKALQ